VRREIGEERFFHMRFAVASWGWHDSRTSLQWVVAKALHESVAEGVSGCFLIVSTAEDSKILER
jgi:hypothetical protein